MFFAKFRGLRPRPRAGRGAPRTRAALKKKKKKKVMRGCAPQTPRSLTVHNSKNLHDVIHSTAQWTVKHAWAGPGGLGRFAGPTYSKGGRHGMGGEISISPAKTTTTPRTALRTTLLHTTAAKGPPSRESDTSRPGSNPVTRLGPGPRPGSNTAGNQTGSRLSAKARRQAHESLRDAAEARALAARKRVKNAMRGHLRMPRMGGKKGGKR